MSRKSFVRLAASLVLGWSLVASAATQVVTGKILSVNVNATGHVRITMVGTPALCSAPVAGTPNNVAEFVLNGEAARGMLATLNAAKLSSRNIDFWTDNGFGAFGCRVIAVTLL